MINGLILMKMRDWKLKRINIFTQILVGPKSTGLFCLCNETYFGDKLSLRLQSPIYLSIISWFYIPYNSISKWTAFSHFCFVQYYSMTIANVFVCARCPIHQHLLFHIHQFTSTMYKSHFLVYKILDNK